MSDGSRKSVGNRTGIADQKTRKLITRFWFVHFRIFSIEKIEEFLSLSKTSGHFAVFELGTFRI